MTHLMLAKNFDSKHVEYPCYVSEKIDGFACSIERVGDLLYMKSRQGKPLPSAQHIVGAVAYDNVIGSGEMLVGELYVPGKTFKDAGGIIRRKEVCTDVLFGAYDLYTRAAAPFCERLWCMERRLPVEPQTIHMIPQTYCENAEDIQSAVAAIYRNNPDAEGTMLRSASHLFEPGKRSWGMMRSVPHPTYDLKVQSIEEAVSETGRPLGRVGRFNCYYGNGEETLGVAAGKLTHEEARDLYWNPAKIIGKIIEVKYKKDLGYTLLRQPTFQRVRDDKTIGDKIHGY